MDRIVGQCPAVQCTDVSFSYSAKCPVLRKLSMSVPQSVIYSLLGASSSGKTTLIKIITGLLKAHSGTVRVFGQPTGSVACLVPGAGVGFMPQDLHMYPNFSIETTLTYFAQINGVDQDKIKDRIKYLHEFLELPDRKRLVSKLSGGQQRRVSLAVALIHDPLLVILDEPTVGVDPFLRYKIWNYLHDLCSKGTTLIITTHYIEETVSSNLVAFIRNGELICEQCPQKLMQTYQESNLERALYILCMKQNSKTDSNNNKNDGDDKGENTDNVHCSDQVCDSKVDTTITGRFNDKIVWVPMTKTTLMSNSWAHQWNQFKIVFKRTMKLLTNEYMNLYIVVFYPFVILLLLNFMFYKLPDQTNVAVIWDEVDQFNGSMPRYMSRSLASNMRLHTYSRTDQLVDSIAAGQCEIGFVFSPNFTECVRERFELGIQASEEAIECSQIQTYVDTTNLVHIWTIAFRFLNSFQESVQTYVSSMNLNPQTFLPPIDIYNQNGDKLKLNFEIGNYILMGLISTVNFFIPMSASGLIWLKDREHDIMMRSQIHDVSILVFLFAHFVALAFCAFLSSSLVMALSTQLFPVSLSWNWVTVYCMFYMQEVTSIFVGQVLAIMTGTQMDYIIVAMGVCFPTIFVSGVYWPMNNQRPVVNTIAYMLPLALPTSAIRNLFLKNRTISDPIVFDGFFLLSIYFTIFMLIAIVLLRKSTRN